MQNYSITALGMMSGTSLDGIDLSLGNFSLIDEKWDYQSVKAETIEYPAYWIEQLTLAPTLGGEQLLRLHREYGRFIGQAINLFLEGCSVRPSLAGIHGHTIFHDPARGFNFQLGDGAAIAATTGLKIINDFRSLDICLGGQGAPLVPIADRLLWGEYAACLNLGGFANVSFEQAGERVAFDIAPANLGMNYFARKLGRPFDNRGEMARKGEVNNSLLEKLDNIPFYRLTPPKSLGREWFEREFLPLVEDSQLSPEDILATLCEHLARRVGADLQTIPPGKMLITGGGAHNHYLIERIKACVENLNVVVPEKQVVDFKEAIAFAFLGILRYLDKTNCLRSVTGAATNCSSGSITG